ncbi:MAG: TIGR03790 family protein [Desulfobacterales bacterium]|nr:TIGR03790 family protein [Desulfobacterales bacterium]
MLANRNDSGSLDLAKYYMKKRGIPVDNLVRLWVTDKEEISRTEYERNVAIPVRRHLKDNDPFMFIRCLVIMYGIPLRVAPPEMNAEERGEVEKIKKRRVALSKKLRSSEVTEEEQKRKITRELEDIKKRVSVLKKGDQASSLDSEIALVLEEHYSLSRWIPNPYFLGYRGKQIKNLPEDVFLVSRLDGPSEQTVRRVIDDSMVAEKNGLQGTAYFDARWADPGKKETSAYRFYDQSLQRAANLVKKNGLMPIVLDDRQALFQRGDCPDAALYCGWYSLANYVDAFEWQPGAVGYHIASSECVTLKRKNSRTWCKMMLEKGVAATIGPVGEPYVRAFPVPEIFFGLLIQGRLSLAECYAASNPFLSWKMVLIGDPLYCPFKNSGSKKTTHKPPTEKNHRGQKKPPGSQHLTRSYGKPPMR